MTKALMGGTANTMEMLMVLIHNARHWNLRSDARYSARRRVKNWDSNRIVLFSAVLLTKVYDFYIQVGTTFDMAYYLIVYILNII